MEDLTEEEKKMISNVLKRDLEVKSKEIDRVDVLKHELEVMKSEGLDDSENQIIFGAFMDTVICVRCKATYYKSLKFINKYEQCPYCTKIVCKNCLVIKKSGSIKFLCKYCSKLKEIEALSGAWHYAEAYKSPIFAKNERSNLTKVIGAENLPDNYVLTKMEETIVSIVNMYEPNNNFVEGGNSEEMEIKSVSEVLGTPSHLCDTSKSINSSRKGIDNIEDYHINFTEEPAIREVVNNQDDAMDDIIKGITNIDADFNNEAYSPTLPNTLDSHIDYKEDLNPFFEDMNNKDDFKNEKSVILEKNEINKKRKKSYIRSISSLTIQKKIKEKSESDKVGKSAECIVDTEKVITLENELKDIDLSRKKNLNNRPIKPELTSKKSIKKIFSLKKKHSNDKDHTEGSSVNFHNAKTFKKKKSSVEGLLISSNVSISKEYTRINCSVSIAKTTGNNVNLQVKLIDVTFIQKIPGFNKIKCYVECKLKTSSNFVKHKTEIVKNETSPLWNQILTFKGITLNADSYLLLIVKQSTKKKKEKTYGTVRIGDNIYCSDDEKAAWKKVWSAYTTERENWIDFSLPMIKPSEVNSYLRSLSNNDDIISQDSTPSVFNSNRRNSGMIFSTYMSTVEFMSEEIHLHKNVLLPGYLNLSIMYSKAESFLYVKILKLKLKNLNIMPSLMNKLFVRAIYDEDATSLITNTADINRTDMTAEWNQEFLVKMNPNKLKSYIFMLDIMHEKSSSNIESCGQVVFKVEDLVKRFINISKDFVNCYFPVHQLTLVSPYPRVESEIELTLHYTSKESGNGKLSLTVHRAGPIHSLKTRRYLNGSSLIYLQAAMLPCTDKSGIYKSTIMTVEKNNFEFTHEWEIQEDDLFEHRFLEILILLCSGERKIFLAGCRMGTPASPPIGEEWQDSNPAEHNLWKLMLKKDESPIRSVIPLRTSMFSRFIEQYEYVDSIPDDLKEDDSNLSLCSDLREVCNHELVVELELKHDNDHSLHFHIGTISNIPAKSTPLCMIIHFYENTREVMTIKPSSYKSRSWNQYFILKNIVDMKKDSILFVIGEKMDNSADTNRRSKKEKNQPELQIDPSIVYGFVFFGKYLMPINSSKRQSDKANCLLSKCFQQKGMWESTFLTLSKRYILESMEELMEITSLASQLNKRESIHNDEDDQNVLLPNDKPFRRFVVTNKDTKLIKTIPEEKQNLTPLEFFSIPHQPNDRNDSLPVADPIEVECDPEYMTRHANYNYPEIALLSLRNKNYKLVSSINISSQEKNDDNSITKENSEDIHVKKKIPGASVVRKLSFKLPHSNYKLFEESAKKRTVSYSFVRDSSTISQSGFSEENVVPSCDLIMSIEKNKLILNISSVDNLSNNLLQSSMKLKTYIIDSKTKKHLKDGSDIFVVSNSTVHVLYTKSIPLSKYTIRSMTIMIELKQVKPKKKIVGSVKIIPSSFDLTDCYAATFSFVKISKLNKAATHYKSKMKRSQRSSMKDNKSEVSSKTEDQSNKTHSLKYKTLDKFNQIDDVNTNSSLNVSSSNNVDTTLTESNEITTQTQKDEPKNPFISINETNKQNNEIGDSANQAVETLNNQFLPVEEAKQKSDTSSNPFVAVEETNKDDKTSNSFIVDEKTNKEVDNFCNPFVVDEETKKDDETSNSFIVDEETKNDVKTSIPFIVDEETKIDDETSNSFIVDEETKKDGDTSGNPFEVDEQANKEVENPSHSFVVDEEIKKDDKTSNPFIVDEEIKKDGDISSNPFVIDEKANKVVEISSNSFVVEEETKKEIDTSSHLFIVNEGTKNESYTTSNPFIVAEETKKESGKTNENSSNSFLYNHDAKEKEEPSVSIEKSEKVSSLSKDDLNSTETSKMSEVHSSNQFLAVNDVDLQAKENANPFIESVSNSVESKKNSIRLYSIDTTISADTSHTEETVESARKSPSPKDFSSLSNSRNVQAVGENEEEKNLNSKSLKKFGSLMSLTSKSSVKGSKLRISGLLSKKKNPKTTSELNLLTAFGFNLTTNISYNADNCTFIFEVLGISGIPSSLTQESALMVIYTVNLKREKKKITAWESSPSPSDSIKFDNFETVIKLDILSDCIMKIKLFTLGNGKRVRIGENKFTLLALCKKFLQKNNKFSGEVVLKKEKSKETTSLIEETTDEFGFMTLKMGLEPKTPSKKSSQRRTLTKKDSGVEFMLNVEIFEINSFNLMLGEKIAFKIKLKSKSKTVGKKNSQIVGYASERQIIACFIDFVVSMSDMENYKLEITVLNVGKKEKVVGKLVFGSNVRDKQCLDAWNQLVANAGEQFEFNLSVPKVKK